MSFVSLSAGNTTISGSSVDKNSRYLQLSANSSTIVGFGSGDQLDGAFNTVFGYLAATQRTKMNYVNVLGFRAGELSTGNRNTLIGSSAGRKNIRGFDNIFLGHSAGEASFGSENVTVGNFRGRTLKGAGNVLLGFEETPEAQDDGTGEFETDLFVTEGCVVAGYASRIAGVDNVSLGARNVVGTDAERTCLLGERLTQEGGKVDNVVIGSRVHNSGSGCVLIAPERRHGHAADAGQTQHDDGEATFSNTQDGVINIAGHVLGRPEAGLGYAMDLDADVIKVGRPDGVCLLVTQDNGIQMAGATMEINDDMVSREYFVRSMETGVKSAIFRRRVPWTQVTLEPPFVLDAVRSATCSRTHEHVTLTHDLTFSVSAGDQTEVRVRLPAAVRMLSDHPQDVPTPSRIFKRPGKTTYASPERGAAGTVTLMTSGQCFAASSYVEDDGGGNGGGHLVLRLNAGESAFLPGTYDASGSTTFDGRDAM